MSSCWQPGIKIIAILFSGACVYLLFCLVILIAGKQNYSNGTLLGNVFWFLVWQKSECFFALGVVCNISSDMLSLMLTMCKSERRKGDGQGFSESHKLWGIVNSGSVHFLVNLFFSRGRYRISCTLNKKPLYRVKPY